MPLMSDVSSCDDDQSYPVEESGAAGSKERLVGMDYVLRKASLHLIGCDLRM